LQVLVVIIFPFRKHFFITQPISPAPSALGFTPGDFGDPLILHRFLRQLVFHFLQGFVGSRARDLAFRLIEACWLCLRAAGSIHLAFFCLREMMTFRAFRVYLLVAVGSLRQASPFVASRLR